MSLHVVIMLLHNYYDKDGAEMLLDLGLPPAIIGMLYFGVEHINM